MFQLVEKKRKSISGRWSDVSEGGGVTEPGVCEQQWASFAARG